MYMYISISWGKNLESALAVAHPELNASRRHIHALQTRAVSAVGKCFKDGDGEWDICCLHVFLRCFRRFGQFTKIGRIPGGQRPFEREGGPVCYEAMPSASFHLVGVWLRPDCLGWGNFERRMIVCIRKEKPT